MLNAILEGKAGRVTLNEDKPQSWRAVFKSYEDLLTAAIFSRINYLSPAAMEIFFSSLLGVKQESWGDFESIKFWPKYIFPSPIDERMKPFFSRDEQFVEPDLVLTFEHAALLIEVKPPAGGIQYQLQWRKELYTYIKDDNAKENIHFLALGNLPPAIESKFYELKEQFPQVTFYGREWHDVRKIFQYSEWKSPQDKRIVIDCLKALALYGIREPLLAWQQFYQFLEQTNLPSDILFLKEK